MIWFFAPYAFSGHLFEAYDQYMGLIQNEEDWVCMMDGDVLFFQSNYGHLIEDNIRLHPEAGLFTGYASRIGNHHQTLAIKLREVDSIKFHYKVAMSQEKDFRGSQSEIKGDISGFLMVIQKKSWTLIREDLMAMCSDLQLLKVDNMIARALHEKGLKIIRMDNIYMLHYYRFVEGTKNRGIS